MSDRVKVPIPIFRNDTIEIVKEHFPKTCSCGRIYNETTWKALPAPDNRPETADEFGRYSWRNCPCGSTMMIELEVREP